jgi:hypothetical protein
VLSNIVSSELGASFNILLLMFYFDLYIINVDVILPPDLGPFAINKYIHTYICEILQKKKCKKKSL